ncbi:hypothetical protein [uncultured Methanospirillum sp.]|nr:hypothetical protein [uncultured Methanospirillum sp.]
MAYGPLQSTGTHNAVFFPGLAIMFSTCRTIAQYICPPTGI